jgi:hypothetical protein
MNARAKAFFRRTRARLRSTIQESRQLLVDLDGYDELHPEQPPVMDRGQVLIHLAWAKKALASLEGGKVRGCLERDEPIPPLSDW